MKAADGATARIEAEDESGGASPGLANTRQGDSYGSGRSPNRLAADRGAAIAVFVLTLLYLLVFRRYTAMDPDEGIILQGAQRILHGQVLYRDFFSFFTPGSYYLLASLFTVFGSSMMVARTALAFYGAVLSLITYLLARRVCTRAVALAIAGLATLTSLPYRFLVLHNWDSTVWAALAIYCSVRWLEAQMAEYGKHEFSLRPGGGKQNGQRRPSRISRPSAAVFWAFSTASLVAITILFEQSKGAGLALGLAFGLAIPFLLCRKSLKVTKVCWLAVAPGLMWPFAATFGYFDARHALGALWADWLWPLHHYSQANRVLYGYQAWSDHTRAILFGSHSWGRELVTLLVISPCFIVPVLPLIALGILLYLAIRIPRRWTISGRAAHYFLISAALSGLLLSVVAVRADIIHFMYLAPLFYLVLAWIIDGRDIRSSAFQAALPALRVAIFVSFGFLAFALLLRTVGAKERLETRRGIITASAPDTVLSYTMSHVPAGSRILVYPYLPLYYYLTATYSPTRFEYLQPGMTTRAQDEKEIHEIAASHPSVVVFEPGFNEKIASSWPNTPLQYIANDPVGDYLLARYRPCKVLKSAAGWRFLFMVRKGLLCHSGAHK